MDFIIRLAEEFFKKHKRLARYRRIFAFLAAVVVFATTYELILPAITMDRQRAVQSPGVEVGVAKDQRKGIDFMEDESLAVDTAGEDSFDAGFPEDGDYYEDNADSAGDGYVEDYSSEETGSADDWIQPEDPATGDTWNNASEIVPGAENTGDDYSGSDGSGTWTDENEIGTDAADNTGASGDEITDGSSSEAGEGVSGTDPSGTENGEADPEVPDAADGTGLDGTGFDGTGLEEGEDGENGLEDSGSAPDADGQDPETVDGEGLEGTPDASVDSTDSTEKNSGDALSNNTQDASADTTASGDKSGKGSAASAGTAENSGEAVIEGSTAETAVEFAAGGAAVGATDLTALGATGDQAAAEVTYPATIVYEGKDYIVTATFDETAKLPAEVTLNAVEILPNKVYKDENGNPLYADYEEYYEKTLEALEKESRLENDQAVKSARFFDITFLDKDGNTVEPAASVSIAVKYKDALSAADTADTMAVHFEDTAKADNTEKTEKKDNDPVEIAIPEIAVPEILDTKTEVKKKAIQEISFEAEKFSVYGVIGTEVIEKTVLASDGHNYKITVTYGPEAEIPNGAELEVEEISDESEEYKKYVAGTENILAEDEKVSFARFFDIKIVKDDHEIQPAEPVNVRIELADELTEEVKAVHFEHQKDAEEETENTEKAVLLDSKLVAAEELRNAVSFDADGFSVYGIIGTETITTHYISASGDIYEITVSYDADANIPKGSELIVSEVSRQAVNEAGVKYSDVAKDLLKVDAEKSETVILFDISIVKDGQKVQPAAPVSVDIKLTRGEIDETAGVVHFGEKKTEVLNASLSEDVTTFETSSFSIFALKEKIDNLDGTYDLFLSVTGTSSSVTTYTDINVIFVMDTSQSMTFRATSETGSMVTWNPLTATIWGNSSYLDQYSNGRAGNTGYNVSNEAYYFNLYKQTGSNRYERIQEGDQTPLEQLYVRNGNTYTRVGTINISGRTPIRVSGSSTTDPTPSHNAGTCSHEDTRLMKTKSALETVMSSLAAKNTEANPDAVEMLLITFNGSASTGDWGTSVRNIPTNYDFYTRWDLALSAAQTAAQNKKIQESSKEGGADATYVIFITDGTPTSYDDNPANKRTAQNAANDLNSNYGGLHLVFAYGTDTSGNLQDLSHTGLYEAQSTEALVSALSSIIGQINNANAYEQVVYNDGVTSLTTSLVAKDYDNITFKKYRTVIEEDGKYYYEDTYDTEKEEASAGNIVTTKDANNNSVKYDKTTFVDYLAEYSYNTETKSLEWNVSDTRLEKGWLYTCRFTVWPSQAAYDLVADLNNGARSWSDLTDEERASISDASHEGTGPFSLLTNTEGTKISYNEIKSSSGNKLPDGVTKTNTGYAYNNTAMTKVSDTEYTLTIGTTVYKLTIETDQTGGTTYTLTATTPGESQVTNPEPVDLADGEMAVSKVWKDEINPRNKSLGVNFYVWKDGSIYQTKDEGGNPTDYVIHLDEHNNWSGSVTIAPGVMTVDGNNEVHVLETGHKYSLTEIIPHGEEGDYNDYGFEFTSETVRPMVVNSTLEYLVLVTEHYPVPDGAKTYTIGEETYYVKSGEGEASISGTNHKTSELDITKEIDDTSLSDKTSDELDKEEFTYSVTLNTPERSADHGVKLWIYTPEQGAEFELPEYNNLGVSSTSQDITINNNTATVSFTINRTQIARFTNLPTGTTYIITETGANGDTLESQGYVITGVGQSDSASRPDATSGTDASGTISKTNTRYYNHFKNKLTSVDAELKVKKAVSGYQWKAADEYEFTISAAEGVPMPEKTVVKVNSETDQYTSSFGEVRFTKEGKYTYTVTETDAGEEINGVQYGAGKTIVVTVEKNTSGELVVTDISEGYVAAANNSPASGTVTITNTWAVTEANAKKAWENADGTTSVPANAEVVFTLFADGDPTEYTVTLKGTAADAPSGNAPAGYESPAWTANFVNLPKYKIVDNGTQQIVYTIKETTGYPGYKASTTQAVTSGQTITNSQLSAEIKLLKIGDGKIDVTLDGVEFELYSTWHGADATDNVKAKSVSGQEVGTITTADGGRATIAELLPGTYYLVETKTADGYNMLAEAVEIYIQLSDQEPGYTVSYKQNGYVASQEAGNLSPGTDGAYLITVSNPSGAELPMTGGSGFISLQTLCGIMAMAFVLATALMYGFSERRGERRYK